ncbi:hypothetical protein E2C01_054785 [Portunus trituberculatus]|uniref:Uncharacterized protein n=1 Tax=Portunus trituberculatus TaxID=210409 RepID=A0A5B7GSV7_PORTR|nr:hypothetical protein [Portunus trituberculatus]
MAKVWRGVAGQEKTAITGTSLQLSQQGKKKKKIFMAFKCRGLLRHPQPQGHSWKPQGSTRQAGGVACGGRREGASMTVPRQALTTGPAAGVRAAISQQTAGDAMVAEA